MTASKGQTWSRRSTPQSKAIDLGPDVFKLTDPKAIAASLKRFAEANLRRRSTPFRSAMSMLTFYINRAGRSLTDKQRAILERAKDELRIAFGRKPEADRR